jgi:hypothetical protein
MYLSGHGRLFAEPADVADMEAIRIAGLKGDAAFEVGYASAS